MFLNGSPHAVTDLWDVGAHHANLKFTCRRCGHWQVFHAAAVWWRFKQRGWSGHLAAVPQRFFCTVCRKVKREKVRPHMEIVKELENGNLPLPPEQEWKQEAKRRR
jgi:hypothetical protein